jgi:site-specific DNA recombinase
MHEADRHDGWRIPAAQLETLVLDQIAAKLRDRLWLLAVVPEGTPDRRMMTALPAHAAILADRLCAASPVERGAVVRELVDRIDLAPERIAIALRRSALWPQDVAPPKDKSTVRIDALLTLRRRGQEARLVIAVGTAAKTDADPTLCRLIARAHRWNEQLVTGAAPNIDTIARAAGVHPTEVGHVIRLAYLAPDIVEAILDGRQPVEVTAERLRRLPKLPSDWDEQRRVLGFQS